MKSIFSKLLIKLDKPLWGLSFYFILASIILWNTCGTSFVDDSLEWIVSYKKFGWKAYWHSYDMTSVYWFHDLFSNLMHIVFGKNNFAWYFIILSFHSSACYYMYRFLVLIFAHNDRTDGQAIAFIASLIFLFGAYHTENLFWIATYHYEVTIVYFFLSLFYLAFDKGVFIFKKRWWIIALFPFMLTMHEISFFFPFAFLLTIFYYRYDEAYTRHLWIKLIKFGLPFAIFSIAILICTKLIKGSFIPHYGISHVQDHSLYGFLYTLVNYLIKHLVFIHNYSFPIREKFYDIDSKTMYVFFAICFALISFIIYRIKNSFSHYKDYFLILILMLLFYIPVSNMYFFWHFPIQNDRLGYYTSAFLYSLVALFLITSLRKIGIALSVIFLLFNVFFLRKNINALEESIHFTENITIPSYKPYLDKHPVILNMPYNYKGFYSFRKIFRFKSTMYWAHDRDIDFTYTTSMPFFNSTDSVEVNRINDSIFNIQLRAPGAWLMKESLGGSDYENEEVKVDYADDNQSAMIYLKNYNRSQPILYCTGSRGFVEYK
jgi:hypothetical protein